MAGLIPPATLEQIRAANDIVDVIGGVLPLKRAGANFVALCPFHKEKTPSFNVSPHKQIFHCYGCHKGGDVFTFIREYEGLSFIEAARRLADRAKIPLELVQGAGGEQSRFVKDTLLQIHEQITQRWQSALTNDAAGEVARAYLAKRGVSEEAVKLFRLGYAPEAWDDTVNWARSKNYDLALIQKAGLIIQKEGGGYYDRFRGRLMFPICDEQGRVIAFSGRVLGSDEKTAKYVNSPETDIFKKSKVFFGLDKSKRAILDAQFAIVCEGQLDLIACFMAGVRNIVAPQGTAFTTDHARILKRYVDEVVLCFDSDNAGQNAAVRVLDSLLGSGLAIRVATVPAPHDPDSFIKAFGPAAFHELINKAEGFFDYYLDRLCATNDVTSDKGQQAVVRAMAEALHKTDNVVLLDRYAQKTAGRLGVTADAMRAQFKKRSAANPARARPDGEISDGTQSASTSARPASREFWLLKLLLLHDDLCEWAAAHLEPGWIQDSTVRGLVLRRLQAPAGHFAGPASLIHELTDDTSRSLVTEALAESRAIPNPPRQLHDVVLWLRNQYLDKQIESLTRQAADPSTAEAERLSALRQRQTLHAAKKEPLTPLGKSD
ncbi:MAG: DNA primase [Verrucomicrobiales bacterium]|nr:DNA primase [Verrucomicrobiales bacterium]